MKQKIEDYLKRLEEHHRETYEHSLRVASLSKNLGEINFLQHEDVTLLYNSGLLHDIGKIEVSPNILSKAGSLNESEKEEVENHVREGFRILRGPFFRDIREVIARHHEFSRNPYPRDREDRRQTIRKAERRTKDKRFSILGQILAVSDMYDALRMKRSYKPSLKLDEVEKRLNENFIGDMKYIQQVISL